MKNITLTDWTAVIVKLAADVAPRCPGVESTPSKAWDVDEGGHEHEDHEVALSTECCTGRLSLQGKHEDKTLFWVPRINIGSGRSLNGSLSQVEAGLFEYRSVLDGLHYLKAATDGYRIFPDGECPCDHCAATGTTRDGKCKRCEGKGKR